MSLQELEDLERVETDPRSRCPRCGETFIEKNRAWIRAHLKECQPSK
jgi:ribosomal protein S27AE